MKKGDRLKSEAINVDNGGDQSRIIKPLVPDPQFDPVSPEHCELENFLTQRPPERPDNLNFRVHDIFAALKEM